MNCIIEGCDKPARQLKMCSMHYMRFHVHGDPHYSYDSPEQVSIRFWSKVDKTPGYGPWGDCWRFTGRLDKDGYGTNTASRKYEVRAHRFAYAEKHGPIPDALIIRHRCDVRDCVNDDHLLSGTHRDNAQDREEHGHSMKGEGNPRAKLTEADVLEIRQLVDPAKRNKARLARQFGVSDAVVGFIHARKSWAHI